MGGRFWKLTGGTEGTLKIGRKMLPPEGSHVCIYGFFTAILITYMKGGIPAQIFFGEGVCNDEGCICYFFTEVIKFYWLMLLLYPGELYRLLVSLFRALCFRNINQFLYCMVRLAQKGLHIHVHYLFLRWDDLNECLVFEEYPEKKKKEIHCTLYFFFSTHKRTHRKWQYIW